jgi:hypothetical protein
MSTNFTLHIQACPACRRSEARFHIGKRSGGWKFLWRGYRNPSDAPFFHPMLTREDWEKIILDPLNQVFDEYGEIWSPAKFIAMAKEWDMTTNNIARKAEEHTPCHWTDNAGCEFYDGEFC